MSREAKPWKGGVRNSTLSRRSEIGRGTKPLARGAGPRRTATLAAVNPAQRAKRRDRYAAFIRSAAWKAIRLETFRLADFRCAVCGWQDETRTGAGLVGDHVHYTRFGGDEIPGRDVRCLCRRCDREITVRTRPNWMGDRRGAA